MFVFQHGIMTKPIDVRILYGTVYVDGYVFVKALGYDLDILSQHAGGGYELDEYDDAPRVWLSETGIHNVIRHMYIDSEEFNLREWLDGVKHSALLRLA